MPIKSASMFVVGLGLACFAAPAYAADLSNPSSAPFFAEPGESAFDVTVGAGPSVSNRFPGSKESIVLPSFHFNYRKANELESFYAPDDAVSISVYDNAYLHVGPAANFLASRGQGGGFYGLHGIDSTFLVGGFAELYPIPGHLRIRGELLQGVTGSRGLIGNIGADAIQRFGRFEFSAGPRFQLGNDRYASQYFSVTSSEALLNRNVTAYTARGGVTSVGALGTVRYDISRQYSLLFSGGYSRLVDSVGASPILQTIGTANQYQAGVTLNYTFGFRGVGVLGY